MKKTIAAILAGLSLLTLSGCGSLYEDDYYYEAPYSGVIGPRSDSAITEVRNYNMLKTALTNMIVNHIESGELRFADYNGNLSEDLAAACFEIKSQHPLGAYAVESLSYDTSYVVSYYVANIYIGYKRTAEELRDIVYTSDTADFDRNLDNAADSFLPKLVIRCYDSGVDERYVLAHVKQHYYDDPVTMVIEPTVEVTGYPADGENRIFDIRLTYAMTQQRMTPMSMVLQDRRGAVIGALQETESPGQALECAAYLSEQCAGGDADAPYADTAYGALVNGNADSRGYALAYRALCAALDIDCIVVEGSFGTMGGEPHFWNMITLNGDCYHVDVSAFADDPDAAFLQSDDALWGAYIWDTAAYPACGGPLSYADVAGLPEPSEESETEEGEDGQSADAATQTPAERENPPEYGETEPPETETPPEEGRQPEEGSGPSPEEDKTAAGTWKQTGKPLEKQPEKKSLTNE